MSIKIALAGNPNCGKTTLFNALTGSNQFVGNWPGVTVEKKEGKLKGHKDVTVIDLPGIYSLSPYTLEEVVARNYLIHDKPDVILNIIDGTNIERNLYLTTQLIELGIPMIVAVNMMDIVNKNGDKVYINKLSKKLGCDVVEISALKGIGVKEAANKAVEAVGNNVEINHKFHPSVESMILSVEEKLGLLVDEKQKRFFAIKLLEKDDKINEQFDIIPNVDEEIRNMESEFDDDTESIITNERYTYISSIIKECCSKNKKNEKLTISDKIDKVVTNRILALPIFLVIMTLVYYISVTTVGTWVTDWTNDGLFGDGFHLFGIGSSEYEDAVDEWANESVFISNVKALIEEAENADVIGADDLNAAFEDRDFAAFDETLGCYGEKLAEEGFDFEAVLPLDEDGEYIDMPDSADYGVWVPGIPILVEDGLEAIHCAKWLEGLIVDGIVGGVGAVLGFVPQMLVLFLFLAFLEACGYMARVAFIMDRIFRKFGLSGKSFIPILIGTGCGVPGIMASRTIENDRDRKMTIMTTTFIPCGAKVPIITLITMALFNGAWWVAPSAYIIGMAAIIISGIILKKTKMFAGEPAPFVMELPAYHLPTVSNVLRSMWERGFSFIKKAGTIILLSSIFIWVGSVFGNTANGFGFDPDMELDNSILGMIGNVIKFIFVPLGFGNARATVATVMGLVAKEEVVGVFGVLDFEELIPLAGYSFLLFNLLCAPCFAAMGAIKREMNNIKWFWFAIGYQCVFAYVIAFMVYQIGSIFVGNINIIGVILAFIFLALFCYLLFRPYKENRNFKWDISKVIGASK